MSILAQEFVLDAIAAERDGELFPIDFDEVWQSTGYSRKDHAVRFLLKRLKRLRDYRSPDRGNVLESQKYYLNVDGFKFFLAKSNTQQGDETLWYFIEVEKAYRAQLERQFAAAIANTSANNTDYNITLWAVWRDSGIRDPYYVRDVIQGNYDHQVVNQIVCVTRQTYEDLLENFRAMDGADISNLPPDKQRKFRPHSQQGKMNRREPQQRDPNYGYIQLNLF